ncbi:MULTISPECIES: cytochrome c [Bacillales]|uniref:Cytochrome c n=1 Tax=Lysinibacillus louembei TaxID=1470088 RepID=A0ABZ0S2G8_9BACI|nr:MULTISPECIES: cytochrome c [Bacillales]MCT6922568.1 cytochrome c [Metasolibacillus sp.]MCT6939093.1 cytochrome c [Metasolibacillus sp.]WPK11537.1 cytochrome c [Lysinibacillus louembei]
MKNNPVFPYILILAFGIGLIFFMSINGAGKSEEAHEEGGETSEQADGAALVQGCIGCHGGDLTGGMGPNLHGIALSKEEIIDVLVNGKGAMPAGAAKGNEEAVADYILSLE